MGLRPFLKVFIRLGSLGLLVVLQLAVASEIASAATYSVTNLNDSGSGSLREAITNANLSSGADTITFAVSVTGTITLSSDLPEITEALTVVGPGQSDLIIDGAGLYRPFKVGAGKTLTLSEFTLKRGKSESGHGALIDVLGGTVDVANVTFRDSTSSSGSVRNSGDGSVATYTHCSFVSNFVGIGGDYGSTPDNTSNTDTDYSNRTYVIDSVFENNTYGIKQERFTKITGSTFRNNSYAAYIAGLNRTQVLNSTFEDNNTALGFGNWTPTSWTSVGANNRYINGNTFSRNSTAFQMNDSWNDGHRSQRWTTITNNTWDGSGTWISATEWDGSTNASITKTDVNSTGVAWTESGNVNSLAVPSTSAAPLVVVPPADTTTTTSTSVAQGPSTVVAVLPLVATDELPGTGSSPASVFFGLGLVALAASVLAARKRVFD